MDSIVPFTTQKRPGEKGSDQQPPRKRARQSCETCKAKKTKCVGIENGACQNCAQLGVPCEVNLKTRKRPFYRISEEVHESSIALLRRFVSEEELPELTVEGIQAIHAKLDERNASSRSPRSVQVQRPTRTNNAEGAGKEPAGDEVMEPDEHPILQEALGCMVLDSLGKYRYVGPDSGIRWNHAARRAQQNSLNTDPKVIAPLKTGLLPPKTLESLNGACRREVYLPPNNLCMRYAGLFFQEIHCLYWFYSLEQFYSMLDQTLEGRGIGMSASWLCSLYSIFAIGSMTPVSQKTQTGSVAEGAVKQAADYLALAKELSAEVSDEADVESVKASGLLSLAMHAMCHSIGAYLHLGTAVRIGFSLGLHRNISPRTSNSVERERGRRLWWTIYTLDHEMAIRFGYPCAVGNDAGFMNTPLSSEQIMDPGPNMPLGYQALSVSLVQLRRKISHSCFLEPAQVGGRLPMSRVFESLNALKCWLNEVPPYLGWGSSHPPQHRRPVSILHLRYYSSVIFVTRPFLLFISSRRSTITHAAKAQCYEELSGKCIEAAERSAAILQRMVNDRTLSSRILFDSHCIMETAWILILAMQKLGRPEHRQLLGFCLETVRNMEKIGWCEKILPELEARVHEIGILEPHQEAQHQASNLQYQAYPDRATGYSVYPETEALFLDDTDFNLDISEFDVLETLDLNAQSGRIDVLADGTLSTFQLNF
ncbi:Fungal specific transcription factor [Penicillium robsamsonii]|uniref:Fungal specific transcription factor n=1 Tax=Penicillium robsamsonii TaxID=1792511 RepID=UPI0025486952|nr:Fungal specific transcription factor [Penicillium robsamsonii]KAJ5827171.1 Fungal specific transcription factor [Penicillium robsamsonii]